MAAKKKVIVSHSLVINHSTLLCQTYKPCCKHLAVDENRQHPAHMKSLCSPTDGGDQKVSVTQI